MSRVISVAIALVMTMLISACAPVLVATARSGDAGDMLPGRDDTGGSGQSYQGSSYKEFYLYFHRGAQGGGDILNTVAPSNHETTVLTPGQNIEFRLEVPLTKNLEVFSHETQGGTRGFWLDLNIVAIAATTVKLEVTDNMTTVARTEETITAAVDNWYIPYTPTADSHLFLEGESITLRISVNGTGLAGITINYRQNDKLWVPCNPTGLTIGTYDGENGPTDEFQPNWPDHLRALRVKGLIEDAFGAGDVSSVEINISNPFGTGVYSSTAAGGALNYSFEWDYETGLPVGMYTVTVKVIDQQANEYTATDTFTMKDYGVYIESTHQSEPGGMAEQNVMSGSTAAYIVTLLNCGGLASSFSVSQESLDKSGWNVEISPMSTRVLAAGETSSIYLNITPNVEAGEYATLWFEFKSDNDALARERLQTFTGVTPAYDLRIDWKGLTSKTADAIVSVGGDVTFSFTVSNRGQNPINFSLSLSDLPTKWDAYVDGIALDTVLRINPQAQLSGYLNVSSPDDQTASNESLIVLTLTSVGLSQEIEDTITARVTMSTGLDVSSTTPSKNADPGDNAVFKLTVKNGDPLNSHTIIFEVLNAGDLTITILGGLTQEFKAREIKTLDVQAKLPEKATAGDHKFSIKASFADNTEVFDKMDFTVGVNKNLDLDMEVSPKAVTLKPDEIAKISITLTNKGNLVESRVLDIRSSGDIKASDITVRLDGKVADNLDFDVSPGEVVTIELELEISNDVQNGDKVTMTISVIDKAGFAQVTPEKVVITAEVDANILDVFMDAYVLITIILFVVIIGVFTRLRR